MLHFIIFFITVFNASAQQPSATQHDIAKATQMLSFAKEALIQNTEIAKKEFGMNDTKHQEDNSVKVNHDAKYNTTEYRDIFYSNEDSAIINQAYDYFKQGKKMQKEHIRKFKTIKIKTIRSPIIQLSSILYNDSTSWTVFTNVGKFSHKKPYLDKIKVTGISNSEVEFIIPIEANMKEAIRTMKHDIPEHRDKVSVQNRNLVFRLRVGECIFADTLKIVTQCASTTEEIEKQVEI